MRVLKDPAIMAEVLKYHSRDAQGPFDGHQSQAMFLALIKEIFGPEVAHDDFILTCSRGVSEKYRNAFMKFFHNRDTLPQLMELFAQETVQKWVGVSDDPINALHFVQNYTTGLLLRVFFDQVPEDVEKVAKACICITEHHRKGVWKLLMDSHER